MVLTLLLATSRAKAFILGGALDFQIKLVVAKGTKVDKMRKDFNKRTKNNPEEVKDQTPTLEYEGDWYTWAIENIKKANSSIS